MSRFRLAWLVAAICSLALSVLSTGLGRLAACPFCSAIALTFSEEIGGSDVAVIAKLVELPPEPKTAGALGSGAIGGDAKAKFEILDVLKGEKAIGKLRKFETLYFGSNPVGTLFLVMGVEPPAINWSTPIAISDRGRTYLKKSLGLPKEGADRLAFFQDYLEDEDELLARDAYDEFAKTPYAGLKQIKDRMHHTKILAWVQDHKIPPSRRNLYWMMLGICGRPEDLALFEEKIRSDDKQMKSNALLAAYLALKGPAGMPLLEDLFLRNPDADYIDTYATVMALRFHGQEEKIIPLPRLLEGLHYMLDRPKLADLVIPDLGRWQDWSVMDRLVELFKNADEESIWVRVPVISYLRACPLPKAKQYIDELAKIDPDAVKRANSFFPLSGAAPAQAASSPTAEDKKSAAPADGAAPAASSAPASPSAPAKGAVPGGKKVSGPAPVEPVGDKKTSQANKPVLDPQAAAPLGGEGKSKAAAASQVAAVGPRLSRSGAPDSKVPQVGLWQVLGCMTLAGGVLGAFLLAILRGGQEAAS